VERWKGEKVEVQGEKLVYFGTWMENSDRIFNVSFLKLND